MHEAGMRASRLLLPVLLVLLARPGAAATSEEVTEAAARVSDRTAFFYLGKLIEYGQTDQIFMNPRDPQTEAYISGRFG